MRRKERGKTSTPECKKWHFKCEDNPPPSRHTGSHLHVWADHRRTQLPAASVSSIGELHHCKPPLAPTLCLPQNNCSVLRSSSGGARVSSCIKASGGPHRFMASLPRKCCHPPAQPYCVSSVLCVILHHHVLKCIIFTMKCHTARKRENLMCYFLLCQRRVRP